MINRKLEKHVTSDDCHFETGSRAENQVQEVPLGAALSW
jgi:hypothetical protein